MNKDEMREYGRQRSLSGFFTVLTNITWGTVSLYFGVKELAVYSYAMALVMLAVTVFRDENNDKIVTFFVPSSNILFGILATYFTADALGFQFILLFLDSTCTGNVRFSFKYRKWHVVAKSIGFILFAGIYALLKLNLWTPVYTITSPLAVLSTIFVILIGSVRSMGIIIFNLRSNRAYVVEQNELARKSAEETLAATEKLLAEEKAKNAAMSANEKKSMFLANMSHEMRTPLNVILGMNQMILKEEDREDIRALASNIDNAGKNLLDLVSDLLDLSKIEAGELAIVEKPFKTTDLINSLETVLSEKSKANNLSFSIKIGEYVPDLFKGDMRHIIQIVSNFLGNACKYTTSGRVDMLIEWAADSDSSFYGNLTFTVRDTGSGISEENLAHIYEKFARFDTKRDNYVEGAGLGMSIAKQLSDALRGKIIINSKVGEGTVVKFILPISSVGTGVVSTVKKTMQNKGPIKADFTAKGCSVLIADDTAANLMILEYFLKDTGMEVVTCTGGREAIKLGTERKFDLMIIDHLMPEPDGVEVLHILRKKSINKDTPMMVFTANAFATDKDFYLKEGFSDYISKPVDFVDLSDKVKNLLPKEKVNII